jgi:hypothetical protein
VVLTFKRLSSSCCLHTTQTVRVPLADGPRRGFQLAVHRVLREFLRVFRSIHFVGGFLLREVRERSILECWTVRDGADGLRAHHGWSVIEGACSRVIFGRSAAPPQTVRLGLANSPPGACGQSAWCSAELLSPLLLEFCFRFEIVWGLFLGLVGPL